MKTKPSATVHRWERFKRYRIIVWVGLIVTSLFFIDNLISAANTLVDFFKPKSEKYADSIFLSGIILPFPAGDSVNIITGQGSILTMHLDKEISSNNVIQPSIFCAPRDQSGNFVFDDAYVPKLYFEDNQFRVSLEIYDMYTYNLIAKIVKNRFELVDREYLDYDDGKKMFTDSKDLEIIDRKNNVAFQMWLDENNNLQIRGIFVGSYCTVFLLDGPMRYLYRSDPNYQSEANRLAKTLKPRRIRE